MYHDLRETPISWDLRDAALEASKLAENVWREHYGRINHSVIVTDVPLDKRQPCLARTLVRTRTNFKQASLCITEPESNIAISVMTLSLWNSVTPENMKRWVLHHAGAVIYVMSPLPIANIFNFPIKFRYFAAAFAAYTSDPDAMQLKNFRLWHQMRTLHTIAMRE